MKILYVTTYLDVKANSASIRNCSLIKGLFSIGIEIEVLTIDWPTKFKSDFLHNELREIKIHRTDIFKNSFVGTGLIRASMVNRFKYLKQIKEYIRDFIYFPDICLNWADKIDFNSLGKFDVIISSSDLKSSHYIGEKIKSKFTKAKWVQIWGDPWADDINLSKIHKFRARKKEIQLLQKADVIIYISPLTLDKAIQSYPRQAHKMTSLPRSYLLTLQREQINRSRYNIVYAGALNAGRNIYELLNVLDKYNVIADLPIYISLYGNYNEEDEMKLNCFRCVNVNKAKDFNNLLDSFKESNMLLYISNGADSLQIPGKLYDYFGTDLPILCLVDNLNSTTSAMLESTNRCILVKNSVDSITADFDRIALNMQTQFKVLSQYSPEMVAKKLLVILNS